MIDYKNHYWIIGGSKTKVYSSKSNTLVPVDDSQYVEWMGLGGNATTINSVEDLQGVLAPMKVLPDWIFNAPSFIQPESQGYSKEQLKAYAADARWRKEQSGINLGGLQISTDDRSKALLLGARMSAEKNPNFSTKWVGKDKKRNNLNAAAIIEVSDAVSDHVSNCFSIYDSVCSGIEGGTVTNLDQINSVFDVS